MLRQETFIWSPSHHLRLPKVNVLPPHLSTMRQRKQTRAVLNSIPLQLFRLVKNDANKRTNSQNFGFDFGVAASRRTFVATIVVVSLAPPPTVIVNISVGAVAVSCLLVPAVTRRTVVFDKNVFKEAIASFRGNLRQPPFDVVRRRDLVSPQRLAFARQFCDSQRLVAAFVLL